MLFFCVVLLIGYSSVAHEIHRLLSNESEVLAIAAVQGASSLFKFKDEIASAIRASYEFTAYPNLFDQQDGVYPGSNKLQLPYFGAKVPWNDVISITSRRKTRKLLIMIRHGQAWENLNTYGNDKCEFILNGEPINNFDSDLSDEGQLQCETLHDLLRSNTLPTSTSLDVQHHSNLSVFAEIGLDRASFFVSPLTRTMKTAATVLDGLTTSVVTVAELLRASIGTDVCNYRRSAFSSTADTALSGAFNTTCHLPSDSLHGIYSKYATNFEFKVSPPGGDDIALFTDGDQLWRNDVIETTIETRARVLLAKLFSKGNISQILCLVTHGEMVDAIYKVSGIKAGYQARNTQIVPLVVDISFV